MTSLSAHVLQRRNRRPARSATRFPIAIGLMLLAVGCRKSDPVMEDWSEKTVEVSLPSTGSAKYFANPRLAEARELLLVLRKHAPQSECIYIAEFERGADSEYDYLGAHVGWEIKGGFEPLYRPHVIFAKRHADSWLNARAFRLRTGSVFPGRPFSGPIQVLEREQEELRAEP